MAGFGLPQIVFTRPSPAWMVNQGGQLVQVGNDVPRIEYDPLTITESNLFATSEVPSGSLSDFGLTGGNVSVVPMTGFDNGVQISRHASATSFAYKTCSLYGPATFTVSVTVEMIDGLGPPVVGTAANCDLVLILAGSAPNAANQTVTPLGGNFYRVSMSGFVTNTPTTILHGVWKAATLTARVFNASGFQVERKATASPYLKTTNGPLSNATVKGLFIENLRTNMMAGSEVNANWFNNTPNVGLPGYFFGTMMGHRIVYGSVAGDAPNMRSASGALATAGARTVASMLVDFDSLVGATSVGLSLYYPDADGAGSCTITVNVATKVVSSATNGGPNVSGQVPILERLYNNVYRLSISAVFAKVNTSQIRLYIITQGGATGVFGCLALENTGQFPSSYIPTTSGVVTRSADHAQIPIAGSGWFNGKSGTILIENVKTVNVGNARGLGAIQKTNLAKYVFFAQQANGQPVAYWKLTNSTTSQVGPNVVPGAISKAAITYDATTGQNYVCSNGTDPLLVPKPLEGDYSDCDSIEIGGWLGSNPTNQYGHIRKMRYWPRALSVAELKAMTAPD